MSDDPSPDVLASTGVKRLNKKPIVLVIAIGLFVALALAYAVSARAKAQRKAGPTDAQAEQTHSVQTTDNTVADLTKNMPLAGDVSPTTTPPPSPATVPNKLLTGNSGTVVPPSSGAVVLAAPTNKLPAQKTPAEKAEEDWLVAYRLAQQKKWQTYEAAVASPSKVNTQSQAPKAPGMTPQMPGIPNLDAALAGLDTRRAEVQKQQAAMVQKLASMASGGGGAGAGVGGLLGGVGGGDDYGATNGQDDKTAWAEKMAKGDTANYLMATRTKAISPYELKQGTIIPAIMISGVNSDLPGQLIAQVSQDVWDTATGQYLLIPQGSRLFGAYDSHVTYGQSRVMVAWTRVIYPDGSALDLGGMAGMDQAGYSGFKDKVNNHYMRIFGSALLMSVMSAGVQYAVPEDNNGPYSQPSRAQQAATQISADMARTGNIVLQKNLNIQPTIEIRPGYRFNVMVSKDIVFNDTYAK